MVKVCDLVINADGLLLDDSVSVDEVMEIIDGFITSNWGGLVSVDMVYVE